MEARFFLIPSDCWVEAFSHGEFNGIGLNVEEWLRKDACRAVGTEGGGGEMPLAIMEVKASTASTRVQEASGTKMADARLLLLHLVPSSSLATPPSSLPPPHANITSQSLLLLLLPMSHCIFFLYY